MREHRLVLATAFVISASVALAQQIEVPDWESSVRFELVASQKPIRPGDTFKVALVANIEKGYHLYGPEEAYPSRTEVTVEGDNLEVGESSYPPVEKRELAGLGTYDLYEGSIAIQVPVTLSEGESSGEHTLRATVNYQVCTDFACSAPTSDEIALTLPGGAPGAAVEEQHKEIFKP